MALNEHQKDTDLFGGSPILRHTQIKDHRVRRTVKILCFWLCEWGPSGQAPAMRSRRGRSWRLQLSFSNGAGVCGVRTLLKLPKGAPPNGHVWMYENDMFGCKRLTKDLLGRTRATKRTCLVV